MKYLIKDQYKCNLPIVMGQGQKFLNQISYLWFGFEKFPLKISNFSIFFPLGPKKSHRVGSKNTWIKDGSASYLLQVKNMLGLGQGLSLNLSLGTPTLPQPLHSSLIFCKRAPPEMWSKYA